MSVESLKKIEKENPSALTIKTFQLNSDSTAVVSYANSAENQRSGKWAWKAGSKIGNDNFGISLTTDVAIYINGLEALGLQLNKTDGKMKLTVGDYLFEKQ